MNSIVFGSLVFTPSSIQSGLLKTNQRFSKKLHSVYVRTFFAKCTWQQSTYVCINLFLINTYYLNKLFTSLSFKRIICFEPKLQFRLILLLKFRFNPTHFSSFNKKLSLLRNLFVVFYKQKLLLVVCSQTFFYPL